MKTIYPRGQLAREQNGFSVIELMIALFIGLLLLGGLLTIVQNNRRVFGAQNQLAQLQDNERFALTMVAGQARTGKSNAAPPDTITVRYTTSGSDNILSCTGTSTTTGAIFTYI